jgi:hypothetical protein
VSPAGHLYVRQEFDDVFDTAVSFRNAEEPLGTHVYIALKFAPSDTKIRWVTIDVQDGAGAAAPLDRLEIPEDVRQKISERWSGVISSSPHQHQFGEPAKGRRFRGAGKIDRRQDQHE